MDKLPNRLAVLGGIVAFCAAQLLSMLRGVAPMSCMKRAVLSAIAVALLTGLCARIAAGVFREGLNQPRGRP
jgi:hypothetical protein